MLRIKKESYKPYRYSTTKNKWLQINTEEEPPQLLPKNQKLKLGTYNILYGLRCNSKFLRYISADHYRYTEIVESILPDFDGDILCLNEVTRDSLRYILASSYIR